MNIVTRTQGVTKGLAYPFASFAMPEVGIPHYLVPPMENAVLEIYPPSLAPMPSRRVYTYPYISPLVISSLPIFQAEVNPTTLFAQSLLV